MWCRRKMGRPKWHVARDREHGRIVALSAARRKSTGTEAEVGDRLLQPVLISRPPGRNVVPKWSAPVRITRLGLNLLFRGQCDSLDTCRSPSPAYALASPGNATGNSIRCQYGHPPRRRVCSAPLPYEFASTNASRGPLPSRLLRSRAIAMGLNAEAE